MEVTGQTRALLLAATALAAGCGDFDDAWDVETPERHVYDEGALPAVDVPADEAAQDSLPVPFEQIGQDDGRPGIVYSAALAGYYLIRIQDDDIGYHYEYDPVADEFAEDDNLHRKCGATFTQIWLYRFTGRPEFRMSTRRAITYLLSRARWQDDGTLRLRDLGATSLILLSLTEYGLLTGSEEWDDEIAGLGEHLIAGIQPDGSFDEGNSLQWAQAHQALWRLYSYTGELRYREGLVQVARYFYDHRDDDDVIGPYYLYGLWANEPLTELYLEKPEPWLAELVLAVGDDVAGNQYTPTDDDVDPNWIGGFVPTDGGEPIWNSTLKLEAVIDAYRMAEAADDQRRMRLLRRSALIGTAFLQRLQHRLDEGADFAEPDFAAGGTPYSASDPTVRLDVPHHMANAILKVVAYLDLEQSPRLEDRR